MKDNSLTLYAVRDKSTGKFVSDITNPRHKFWEKKGSCESAIKSYNPNRISTQRRTIHDKDNLELVELLFTEESDNSSISIPETGIGDVSDGYHTFNELYHHRAVLFSVICNVFSEKAWKSR